MRVQGAQEALLAVFGHELLDGDEVAVVADVAEGFIGLLVRWNPFSYVLNTLRDGLVGLPPDPLNWIVTGSIALLLLVAGIITLERMGRPVTYWL